MVSATILNWTQVTHGADTTFGVSLNGFSDVAIPFAAWMLIRRLAAKGAKARPGA